MITALLVLDQGYLIVIGGSRAKVVSVVMHLDYLSRGRIVGNRILCSELLPLFIEGALIGELA